VDDISVLELATNRPPVQIMQTVISKRHHGLRVLGNHNRTRVEVDPGNLDSRTVLHVVASGRVQCPSPRRHYMDAVSYQSYPDRPPPSAVMIAQNAPARDAAFEITVCNDLNRRPVGG